jgi:cytosine/adenosine deaminase-related metal-dependent hydrolase
MAEAGVALVTHGAGGLTMPPIEMLRAAGVLVFAGNDDIRDTWSPYGTGDLLERAAIIGLEGRFPPRRPGGDRLRPGQRRRRAGIGRH